MQPDNSSVSEWLAENWSNGLADVIATLASARPGVEFKLTLDPTSDASTKAEPAPSAAGQRGDDCQWWHQMLDNLPQPAVWIGATPAAYGAIARSILLELGVDEPMESDINSTWLDVVAQTGNVLAQQIADRCQSPVTAGPVLQTLAPLSTVKAFVEVGMVGSEVIRIQLGFSQALLDSLAAPPDQPATVAVNHSRLPSATLSIQLHMTVTLGRTAVPLGNILRLSTGAIIEFPQLITDAANVLINDKLIAKGHIVILNGDYAVKLVSMLKGE